MSADRLTNEECLRLDEQIFDNRAAYNSVAELNRRGFINVAVARTHLLGGTLKSGAHYAGSLPQQQPMKGRSQK